MSSIRKEYTDKICHVCFIIEPDVGKKKHTPPLCRSCRGYYSFYKANGQHKCLEEQDCVIYYKVPGCLKCRITKTGEAIKSIFILILLN